jgi:DNA polymerase, archaea type
MATIHGRHIIDTYQQVQRFDVGGKLRSYGLKNAIRDLGLERADRTHVKGAAIGALWNTDRERLIRYALDDVRDVDALSRLTTPTEFYQTQLLPRAYQAVATGGPGEKINDLLLRAYIDSGHSIPVASPPKEYPGGHAELLASGVFRPVVKCDVESLYPSIMLAERITSGSDTLGAYLPMLDDLTRRRLEAKARSRLEAQQGNHVAQSMWEGIQGSFKVLINSFYGYLGYRGGLFNDFDAAARVTISGQRIVKQVVQELERRGAIPIEVDTDGVFFVPPSHLRGLDEEQEFIEAISSALPSGIRLAHDGRFEAMLSLRVKTYALLNENGTLTLKGSALRNRRMERCFRTFLEQASRRILADDMDGARTDYFDLADRIRRRQLPLADILQWGMVNEDTINTQPRLKALVSRSLIRQDGERIEYYEREDDALALREEYAGDENVAYLLKRLHDTAARFRDLFPAERAFLAAFPPITPRTDLEAARIAEPPTQMTLF